MVSNAVCQQIADTVKALRVACPRRVRESLEGYHARVLVPALQQRFPHVEPIVRETVGLMAYLGPPGDGCPPEPLRHECLELVRRYTAALPEAKQRSRKQVQMVLTYGCLWRRSVQSSVGRWDDHWPDAVKELTDIAYNFVVAGG